MPLMPLGRTIYYLLLEQIYTEQETCLCPKELGICSTGKAVVNLDIIKTYSLLQHETIKKSWIQAKGTAGLIF